MAISANKANHLFWLGRYVERVYMTLHLLRKVNDKMIDGQPADYEEFWKKLDATDSYASTGEFQLGMMYDEQNPCSVLSSLNRSLDNAIVLREDIKSETMSYIEMSIALMRRLRDNAESNITNLQPVTDWMLAFGGSLAQRVDSSKILSILVMGQKVEKIDMMLRYDYSFDRIAAQFSMLEHWSEEWPELIDDNEKNLIKEMLLPENVAKSDQNSKWQLCKSINSVIQA